MFACRRRLAALVAVAAAADGLAAAADSAVNFPYVAYVQEAEAFVRSGPGRQHYSTGRVPGGFAVEVFRHDPGGWCAIRPPEGSFSYVPAHQVRLVNDHTAEVTADGVVARVGSALGAQRNAVQVLLQRGEALRVVEPPQPGDAWVRVAPPSGEFRWIAARRLSRTPPTEGAATSVAAAGRWQAQSSGAGYAGPAAIADDGTTTAAAAAAPWPGEGADETPEAFAHLNPVVAASVAGDEVEIVAGSPAAAQLAGFEQPAGAADNASAPPVAPPLSAVPSGAQPEMAAPPASPPATSPGAAAAGQPPRVRFAGSSAGAPADARVAELQLRLSQVVARQPQEWQLAPLRTEAATLLAAESDATVRDQLRSLLDRIAVFETIQTRYAGLAAAAPAALRPLPAPSAGATVAPVGPPLSPPAQVATGGTADVLARVQTDLGRGADAATEARYDAVGTLKPVVSRRENAPRFALVDDHGDVVTFVTASPDVNLQPFVGQRIGVRGSRGFMPEYRRAHVTASRVTPLESTVVK